MPNSDPEILLDRLIAEAPKIAPSITRFAETKTYGMVTDEALDTQNFVRWEAEAASILQEMAQYYGGASRGLYTEYRKIKDEATKYHSRSILVHKVLETLQSARQIHITSAVDPKPSGTGASSRGVNEWVRAADALAMLKPILNNYSAMLRICERAHGGMIRARAEQYHHGEQVIQNHDIPKAFWWAEGHQALQQDWAAGDFSTWIDQKIPLKAFGVTFARADIQKLLPPQAEPPETAAAFHSVHAPMKRRALILTALGLETKAVLSHLTATKEAAPIKGTIFYEGTFKDGAAEWEVRVAEAGAGNAPSAVTAERAITGFEPSLALFVGIAGGIKDVDIGDVVVATHIHGYERGRATADRFIARPDVGRSSYALEQRGRAVVQAAKWTARVQAKRAKPPKGFVAPIAAGEKVIASDQADIARFIREHYSDALAVEMEGRGFLEALHMNQSVAGIVVRGISDLLSGKTKADASGSQPTAAENAAALAFEILATHVWPEDGRALSQSEVASQPASADQFGRNEDVERLLKDVVPGEGKTSDAVALELLQATEADGHNRLFDGVLKYQHCSDENLFWKALPLIESCVRLAPWIIGRLQLFEMASHSNFSVRSTAAAICMDLAQYAPDRVPIDLLQRLSVYNEDWYVQSPANAALKAVASSIPGVLRIYYRRLHAADQDERQHAATNIQEVASLEPGLLDKEELEAALSHLESIGDSAAVSLVNQAIQNVSNAPTRSGYKYGL